MLVMFIEIVCVCGVSNYSKYKTLKYLSWWFDQLIEILWRHFLLFLIIVIVRLIYLQARIKREWYIIKINPHRSFRHEDQTTVNEMNSHENLRTRRKCVKKMYRSFSGWYHRWWKGRKLSLRDNNKKPKLAAWARMSQGWSIVMWSGIKREIYYNLYSCHRFHLENS